MRHPERLPFLLDAGLVLVALAGGLASLPAAATDALRFPGVEVRRGAIHTAGGTFGGRPVSAGDERAVNAAKALLEARSSLPESLRTAVTLQLDPLSPSFEPFDGIVADPETATIAVASARTGALDRGIWAHELAHLAAAGARPRGLAGARLLSAIDEAAADYVAATFTGSTTVGSHAAGEARDLSTPPLVNDTDWAYLGIPSAPWDSHRMGWALAAALLRERSGQALAVDLVRTLADRTPFSAQESPRAVLLEFISRCPAPSRGALQGALSRWVPAPFVPTEEPS